MMRNCVAPKLHGIIFALLTTDDRHAYVRSHQSHKRKFRPDSERELGLLRRMVRALFQ